MLICKLLKPQQKFVTHTLALPDNFHAIIVKESFRFNFFAFTGANVVKHRLKWDKIKVNINGDSTGETKGGS